MVMIDLYVTPMQTINCPITKKDPFITYIHLKPNFVLVTLAKYGKKIFGKATIE
jgi:hypothetical protein